MTLIMDSEVLFSNFRYDPNIYYFFYFGDVKSYYLNSFIQDVLQSKIGEKEVQFIAVVPDVFSQYDYPNIIVINPAIRDNFSCNATETPEVQPTKICCRINSSVFMSAVSSSPSIRKLIDIILENQNELYIYLFESVDEMTLDEINGVTLLGPDKSLSKTINNKIAQYRHVGDLLPTAEHHFCDNRTTLVTITKDLRNEWNDGIFVSCEYSAAGANSLVTKTQEELEKWCVNMKGPFLVSRFIPHNLDPTVLAVVANENDVYIAGIADQVIEDGNRFIGSTFPSVASEKQKKLLHQYTVIVGQMLGRLGYRGIFGCDYIIAHDGTIYFIEINARKQGTTLEFCYTLEQALPDKAPMLPALEYYAVTENKFPENCVELQLSFNSLNWGTYNYKILEAVITTGVVPHNPYERTSFRKIANNTLKNHFVVLEHVGSGFTVMPGTFLARVVSVAETKEDMEAGIRQGVGFINQTIYEA